MASKFFFLTLIAVFVLVNVQGKDDFKDDEIEEELEIEPKIDEIESDAASEKRAFRFRRSRLRTSTSTRGSRASGSRFFGRRSGTSGGTTGTRRFFGRRSGTSGGTTGTRRFFGRRSGGSSTRRTEGGGTGLPSLGTIVDIGQLGMDIANTVLQSIGKVERKIVVSIGNMGGADWAANTIFMDTGSSLEPLPYEIAEGEGTQLAAVKPTGYNTKGVAGCFCYNLDNGQGKSFCAAFKVPYSGDNYWNVKIYDGEKQADQATFNELMQNSPMKAGVPVSLKDLGDGYFLKDCSMTNSGQSILQLSLGRED